jgi:hypothetical protein
MTNRPQGRSNVRSARVRKDESLVELAWRILQQGDTVLLLSLICLLDRNKEIGWPDPQAKKAAQEN